MPITLDDVRQAKSTPATQTPGISLNDVRKAKINPDDPSILTRAIAAGEHQVGLLTRAALGATSGLNNTTANLFMVLNTASKFLTEKTGIPKVEAFGKVEKAYRSRATQLAAKAQQIPGATNIVQKGTEILGALPIELAQAGAAVLLGGPVAGFAGLGALSAADQGAKVAAIEAAKGATIGKIFKVTAGAPRLGRAGTIGPAAGALETATGAEGEDVALSSATMAALSALGAPRRIPPVSRIVELPFRGEATKPRIKIKGERVPTQPVVETPASEVIVEPKFLTVRPRAQVEKASQEFLGRDYSDLEVPDKVVNLNLKRIDGTNDFKRATAELVEFFRNEIEENKRGIISRDQTAQMAQDLDMTVDQLLTRRKGQVFNAEEITAARFMTRNVLEEWHNLGKKIQRGKANDIDKANFLRATALSEAVVEQTLGATGEMGRAFGAFNIRVGPSTLQMKQIRRLIREMRPQKGGPVEIEEFADIVASLERPGALAKFARDYRKATTGEKLLEAWINGLLSGPQTHAVNVLSNSLVAFYSIPETLSGAAVSSIESGFSQIRGKGPKVDRVLLREAIARSYGIIEGASDGIRLAGKVLRTGETQGVAQGTKIELPRRKAIKGVLGEIIRSPGRALLAEDAFFQAVGYRQEIKAQAMRRALKEGKRGSALASRVKELENRPSEEMVELSLEAAKLQTFTNALGPAMQGFQKFADIHPAMRVIFPFIRTPTNIFKFSAKRTPLALLMNDVKRDIRKGGADSDMAIGRIAFSAGLMAWVASAAADGLITGSGPADPELRRTWLLIHQPFSIKVGDRWFSYGRLEPIGTLFGITADFVDIVGHLEEKDGQEIGAAITMSVTRNLTNKTFVQGMSAAAEALADPQRFGPRFTQQLSRSIVPAAVGQFTRAMSDPVLREVRTNIDAIRSRIPGYSQTLPPKRNVWGEPVLLDGGLGPDIVSPIYERRIIPDFTSEEAWRVKAEFSVPGIKLGGLELTPQELDGYRAETGRLAKRLVDSLVQAPYWSAIPTPLQKDLMEREYLVAKSAARTKLLGNILKDDPVRYREAKLSETLVGEILEERRRAPQ